LCDRKKNIQVQIPSTALPRTRWYRNRQGFPPFDADAMPGYRCECLKCGGKACSKATWYRHNEQHKKRRFLRKVSGTRAGIGNDPPPSTKVCPPNHLKIGGFSSGELDARDDIEQSDVDIGGFSSEDIDRQDKITEQTGSHSVSTVCYNETIAVQGL
jgi:hypothetical protein